MNRLNTLLHICCAPCSVMCIETLRNEGVETSGLWYNPNIHPFTEYKARKNTLIEYSKKISLPLDVIDDYGLREFIDLIHPDFDNRCRKCYEIRLDKTAQLAKEKGFDSFTSTLFVSPYQDHEMMKEVANEVAEKHKVKFLYRDFRPYFREGQAKAREMEFYMQKYCGCVFSEEDRYRKKK